MKSGTNGLRSLRTNSYTSATSEVGTELVVVLALIYYPHPMYDQLKPGTTFTVREGSNVVGSMTVCRWLE